MRIEKVINFLDVCFDINFINLIVGFILRKKYSDKYELIKY